MNCQHMTVFPSDRSATVGLETRIIQNKGVPRESDISSYSEYTVKFMQVPCTRKNSWYVSDNHAGYARERKSVSDARIDKSWRKTTLRHHLDSKYQDQPRTSDQVMLLILSLFDIVDNSNEIRTITCEPDKCLETRDQSMNCKILHMTVPRAVKIVKDI